MAQLLFVTSLIKRLKYVWNIVLWYANALVFHLDLYKVLASALLRLNYNLSTHCYLTILLKFDCIIEKIKKHLL